MSGTILICKKKGCEGILNTEEMVPLQTGCHSVSRCYACSECGRIHSQDGDLMFSRAGPAPYLKNGVIEQVDEPVELIQGQVYLTTTEIFLWDLEGGSILPSGTKLVFSGMNDAEFVFERVAEHTKLALHRGDVSFLEEVTSEE